MSHKQNDQIIDLIIDNQIEGEQKPTYDDVDFVNDQEAFEKAQEELNIKMSIEEDRE
jgi:hypothetical protein